MAGLTLLTLYGPNSPFHLNVADTRWGILFALAFVTLPFSVRSVQPVLAELDVETEEAAASLGASSSPGAVADHPAQPGPGHAGRGRTGLRPGHGRVRLGGPHLGQHAVQDRSGLVVDLQPVPERRPVGGGGHLGRAGGRGPAWSCWASACSGAGSTSARPYDAGHDDGGGGSGRCGSWPSATWAFWWCSRSAPIFYRAFQHGFGAAWDAVTTPDALHALWLTFLVVLIAVPLDTVFGVGVALILARHRFPGAWLLDAFVDLPLAVSPVVVGIALILVYGKTGWFGNWLAARGIHVIFSVPGIVMASATVALPYVVREVLPVLQEIGTDQEQAATTLGASPFTVFRRITLPSIRRSLAYGVTLTTARVLGRVRGGGGGVRSHRRPDRDPHPVHPGRRGEPQPRRRLRWRGHPGPHRSGRPGRPGRRTSRPRQRKGGSRNGDHDPIRLQAIRRLPLLSTT